MVLLLELRDGLKFCTENHPCLPLEGRHVTVCPHLIHILNEIYRQLHENKIVERRMVIATRK